MDVCCDMSLCPQAAAARAAALVRVDYQADGDRRPIVQLADAVRLGSLFDEQSASDLYQLGVCENNTCTGEMTLSTPNLTDNTRAPCNLPLHSIRPIGHRPR